MNIDLSPPGIHGLACKKVGLYVIAEDPTFAHGQKHGPGHEGGPALLPGLLSFDSKTR